MHYNLKVSIFKWIFDVSTFGNVNEKEKTGETGRKVFSKVKKKRTGS